MDQPPSYCCKEALGAALGEAHRCWRYSCCCHRFRRAAPNRASIAINYLRYYNYLFLYWDYDRGVNATVRWKPKSEDGRNYCYYYYCCWWAGDVAADGDFRAEAQAVHRPALGDARRVPLNAALVPVAAGERAAAEEVDVKVACERRPGAVAVGQVPSRRAEVRVPRGSRPSYRCCWCWG